MPNNMGRGRRKAEGSGRRQGVYTPARNLHSADMFTPYIKVLDSIADTLGIFE